MNVNSRIARANFTGYASGTIASFTGLQAAPAKVKVNTTGVTECNVVRCGANVWDEEWENGTFNTITGENINNSTVNVQIRSKNFIPILPNVQYRFIIPNSAGWFIFFDKDGNVINNPNVIRSSGTSTSGNSVAINNGVIFTVNEPNVRYTRFYMTSAYPSTYNHDIAINYPSTDTNYHAYIGDTYTIKAGQMVTQIDQLIGINNIFVDDENVDDGTVEVYYVTI